VGADLSAPTFPRPADYISQVNTFLTGLLTGLSLIVAIGAQNAFVLRQGLTRKHIGIVVLICSFSDALLIAAGTAGFGAVLQGAPLVITVFKWLGVAYLLWFAFGSFRRALQTQSLEASNNSVASLKTVVLTVLGFTYLNPHVYLDTVIFVGSLSAQHGNQNWVFSAGAMAASFLWFAGLGFGAKAAARYLAKPVFWRVLDTVIGFTMVAVAINLLLLKTVS
jgi:L-lysine exporter family protein LysE/ArgO